MSKGVVWSLYFNVDPVEGKLYWKPWEADSKEARRWNTRYAGKEAGSQLFKDSYLVVRLRRENLGTTYVHRIIYEMCVGEIPEGMCVDHIDHNRQNNKPDNFRLATYAINNRNASKRKDNTSGYTGINWDNARNCWSTRIQLNGKRKFLGYFDQLEDALLARQTCDEIQHFHPNHGEENNENSL